MTDMTEFELHEYAVLAALEKQKTYAIKEAVALTHEKYPFFSEAELQTAVFRLIGKESLIINGCGLLVKV